MGMEAGFRLGEWVVKPREGCITGRGQTLHLPSHQLAVLVALAERRGEAVDRQTLLERGWPAGNATEAMLLECVNELRATLGVSFGDSRYSRYIATAAGGGYALVARIDPLPVVAPPAPPSVPTASAVPGTGRLHALIVELRRRRVFSTLGAYLVGMWILLQVAETTFEPLHLPGWWLTALTIITVLGIPVVAVLAWAYEITPGGIVRDSTDFMGLPLPKARVAIAPFVVIGVVLIAGVTGIAWWRSIQVAGTAAQPEAESGPPSIAVLPFVDMSPSGGNAYLGDGLSEELSMRLAQLPGLRVAARTSAFEYRDRNIDIRKIGQALGVGHVLEGSVRRAGDSLRVTVQLIDAVNGYHVWAGNYDRDWRDALSIQDDIARSITEALRVVLATGGQPQGDQAADPDARAFDPYLAGLAMLRRSNDMSSLDEAAARFREALAIAPTFARAHAGLCDVGVRRYRKSRDPSDLATAEDSCKAALQLDASLVEAEKALAASYVSGGKFAAGEAIYRGLLARNANDADNHIGLGRALAGLGKRDEAERSFRKATEVEPGYWGAFNALGGFLFEQGRADEAIAVYRRVAELAPGSASAYNNLGAALQFKGDLKASAEAFERSLRIEPSRAGYSNLGTVHYYLGEFEEAASNYERAVAMAGQDQAMWGNLGDALWQIRDRRDDARQSYRRAIALAERELAMTPDQVDLTAQLGYYYGRVGDSSRASEYLGRALVLDPEDVNAQYLSALNAADRGDTAAALRSLEAAIRLGYPVQLIRSAPDFASLAANAQFRSITQPEAPAGSR